MLLVVSHLKIVKEMLKLALGARHQIRMKLESSALSEGSAADVAGRSLLSETYKVTDGDSDSLSRAISEQDVQRVFSEEEAILLEAQLK